MREGGLYVPVLRAAAALENSVLEPRDAVVLLAGLDEGAVVVLMYLR